jgi:hypothetical protein
MTHVLPGSNKQGIVVFKVCKSLHYNTRLLISFGLIIVGFILQYGLYTILPGIVFIFLGNLFLLPSGYTNRVNLGQFDPETDWERVDKHKLDELLDLDRKIRRWDLSTIDISNTLGGIIFLILLVTGGIIGTTAFETHNKTLQILTLDAAVLLLPYWVTGLRSIFTVPKLTMKIKLVNTLLAKVTTQLSAHRVNYYLLLKGKEKKIPQDIKFKVDIANQHRDFLGFYGQITINSINSSVFPYFYVVLVAKKNFGLHSLYQSYSPHKNYVKEFKNQKDVEVLVVRQNTDVVRNGYWTKDKQVQAIFLEGLALAEKAAVK